MSLAVEARDGESCKMTTAQQIKRFVIVLLHPWSHTRNGYSRNGANCKLGRLGSFEFQLMESIFQSDGSHLFMDVELTKRAVEQTHTQTNKQTKPNQTKTKQNKQNKTSLNIFKSYCQATGASAVPAAHAPRSALAAPAVPRVAPEPLAVPGAERRKSRDAL